MSRGTDGSATNAAVLVLQAALYINIEGERHGKKLGCAWIREGANAWLGISVPYNRYLRLSHRLGVYVDVCGLGAEMTDINSLNPTMLDNFLNRSTHLRIRLKHFPNERTTCSG